MNFYDIPNRIERDIVRRAVCAVLLAEADEAELMSEDACLYLSSIYDLCGTDYEDIVPLCESARYGPSADMWGTIYRFKLLPPLKRHIERERLNGMFFIDGKKYLLQNLTLYRGGEPIFGCISHECPHELDSGSIDDGLAEKVLAAAKNALKQQLS